MKFKVKLFATLREGRGKILDMDESEGTVIKEVAQKLDIPEKDIAILLLNGRDAKLSDLISEGDTISIFPPVGGG
ncbi:MoaD/ThiS family protein [Alkalibacter saccharofermentans]|uniref:Molybdopterin converting factor, small subunit n=1 Tax=Alkalibacter saccharofermentans DSM 14828 TaxID=1120975 RepID=A0A1M4TPF1_9FIRM|nr:MoaD/ThiS family protein [Alkalibacter saccharofermentans]SHE46274.1 Molybdopterin converting factor, small subunit [Alkalibacter saccharofermentans DSM 14828]